MNLNNIIKYLIILCFCLQLTQSNLSTKIYFLSSTGAYIDYSRIDESFIFDLDSYITNNYQNKYERTDFYHMRGIEFFEQKNNSIYIGVLENDDNNKQYTFNEGNCTINSSYSLIYNLVNGKKMNNVENSHFTNLNTLFNQSNYNYIITSDILYYEYGTGTKPTWELIYEEGIGYVDYMFNWVLRSENSPNDINSIPYGYIYLRSSAISNGYNNLGLDVQYIDDMLEYVFDLRNYDVDFKLSNNFDNSKVLINLYNGIPSIINVQADEYYGSHSMMTYGYAKYELKPQFISGPGVPEELVFYAVDTGLIKTELEYNFINTNGDKMCWYNTNSAHSYNFVYLNV